MFPILYHAHHSLHSEDIPFWLDLSSQKPAPFLELGCGTGRVFVPLARQGKTVFGLDNDMGMLQVLHSSLIEQHLTHAFLIQADFRAFRLASRFGLILLTCNTYSTLSVTERQLLLHCVADHLNSGGAFVASMPNPLLLERLPRRAEPEIEEIFAHPMDQEPVQVSSGWIHDQDSFTIDWHYDHLLPDGKVERISKGIKHYLTSSETHRQEIQAAGFPEIKLLGDFDGSDYSHSSPQLILLANR